MAGCSPNDRLYGDILGLYQVREEDAMKPIVQGSDSKGYSGGLGICQASPYVRNGIGEEVMISVASLQRHHIVLCVEVGDEFHLNSPIGWNAHSLA